MTITLEELGNRESITTHVPIPASEELRDRYRRIQNELVKRKKRTLHSLARERICTLLDELEAALHRAG